MLTQKMTTPIAIGLKCSAPAGQGVATRGWYGCRDRDHTGLVSRFTPSQNVAGRYGIYCNSGTRRYKGVRPSHRFRFAAAASVYLPAAWPGLRSTHRALCAACAFSLLPPSTESMRSPAHPTRTRQGPAPRHAPRLPMPRLLRHACLRHTPACAMPCDSSNLPPCATFATLRDSAPSYALSAPQQAAHTHGVPSQPSHPWRTLSVLPRPGLRHNTAAL